MPSQSEYSSKKLCQRWQLLLILIPMILMSEPVFIADFSAPKGFPTDGVVFDEVEGVGTAGIFSGKRIELPATIDVTGDMTVEAVVSIKPSPDKGRPYGIIGVPESWMLQVYSYPSGNAKIVFIQWSGKKVFTVKTSEVMKYSVYNRIAIAVDRAAKKTTVYLNGNEVTALQENQFPGDAMDISGRKGLIGQDLAGGIASICIEARVKTADEIKAAAPASTYVAVSKNDATAASSSFTGIRIYVMGDSTAAPYDSNRSYPMTGWAQVFGEQFTGAAVRVENRAVGGRSTKSFIDERRWESVYNDCAAGDYVFIQFGHNDEKKDKPEVYAASDGAYRENLAMFITKIREKKGIPVLLTPVSRRSFKSDGSFYNSHGDYPDAMKAVAKEMNTPLIDMTEKTRIRYEELGAEKAKTLFTYAKSGEYPAYPEGKKDDTHFNITGAREVAAMVADGIRENNLPLTSYLKPAQTAGSAPRTTVNDTPTAVSSVSVSSFSINDAIARASDGDVIKLPAGLYREHVIVSKPVTLDGSAGAVIDPTEPLSASWTPASDIGPGVWKFTSDKQPNALLIAGRHLAALSDKRVQTEGPWYWKTLLAKGTPLSGFANVRGMWLWRPAENTVYVRVGGNDDPRSLPWSVLWNRAPALSLQNVTGARVTGMTFAGAHTAVEITGCTDVELINATVRSFEITGITVTGGSSRCRIVSNFIERGAYENFACPRLSGKEWKENYEIWQIHKVAGHYDRMGINVFRAGKDNKILSNHVRETFDGINIGDYAVEKLSTPLADASHGEGTEIAWNLIEDVRDSGMEVGTGCVNVHIHHNRLLRTHGGLRFKLPRIGPVFIHHNLIEDDRGFNVWFSMDSSPAEGYFYHNTIIGKTAALVYSSMEKGFETSGTPRWHFMNNLIISSNGFFANWTKGALTPNFTSSRNVVVGGGNPWPDDPSKDDSKYVDTVEVDAAQRPGKNSAAAGAGIDLSTYLNGKPLPGCEKGYFTGAAPDAGAFSAVP